MKTIYCDLSRFQETTRKTDDGKEETLLFNKERKAVQKMGKGYQGCKSGSTVAYRSGLDRPLEGKTLWNEIQICPWYLAILGHSPFKDFEGLPDRTGKPSFDPNRGFSNNEPRANVFASRLDVTLLHEVRDTILSSPSERLEPRATFHLANCVILVDACIAALCGSHF